MLLQGAQVWPRVRELRSCKLDSMTKNWELKKPTIIYMLIDDAVDFWLEPEVDALLPTQL